MCVFARVCLCVPACLPACLVGSVAISHSQKKSKTAFQFWRYLLLLLCGMCLCATVIGSNPKSEELIDFETNSQQMVSS